MHLRKTVWNLRSTMWAFRSVPKDAQPLHRFFLAPKYHLDRQKPYIVPAARAWSGKLLSQGGLGAADSNPSLRGLPRGWPDAVWYVSRRRPGSVRRGLRDIGGFLLAQRFAPKPEGLHWSPYAKARTQTAPGGREIVFRADQLFIIRPKRLRLQKLIHAPSV